MGDIADYLTEQGELQVSLHETGMCGEFGPCPYCEPGRHEWNEKYDAAQEE